MNINLQSRLTRDPGGFLFTDNNTLYRAVNKIYAKNYSHLLGSGLYTKLTRENKLVIHKEVNFDSKSHPQIYKIIKPQAIPFISYPYEWSFGQLKDAGLLTLSLVRIALEHKMILKDADSFNIQFLAGKPIFIDTLSFALYEEGKPWIAYRQFCQHFLAPLALMAYKDLRLNELRRIYLDGIPLDLASKLLPAKSLTNPGLVIHLHLHARNQTHPLNPHKKISLARVSLSGILGLVDSLLATIKNISLKEEKTSWSTYYSDNSYTKTALQNKKKLVLNLVNKIKPGTVWDMGSNTGLFSRFISPAAKQVISLDSDSLTVEKNYQSLKNIPDPKILPLVMDFTNPTPDLGFNNGERLSLSSRSPADLILALALIHHLAISQNIPLSHLAHYFSKVCRYLIIEFVPKEDQKVQQMLALREDIFLNYNPKGFEKEFCTHFIIMEKHSLRHSARILYLLKKK